MRQPSKQMNLSTAVPVSCLTTSMSTSHKLIFHRMPRQGLGISQVALTPFAAPVSFPLDITQRPLQHPDVRSVTVVLQWHCCQRMYNPPRLIYHPFTQVDDSYRRKFFRIFGMLHICQRKSSVPLNSKITICWFLWTI
jgi:hypothetical protein